MRGQRVEDMIEFSMNLKLNGENLLIGFCSANTYYTFL